MHRRRLVAAFGAATVPLAGCVEERRSTGGSPTPPRTPTDHETPTESETLTETDLPTDCPTTQEVDVTWPRELDRRTAESFVESYENAYYREVVVAYEPESQLDRYGLEAYADDPRSHGDGWVVSVSGSGGVYRPELLLGAIVTSPPAEADVVSIDTIEDSLVRELVTEAAESGEADRSVDRGAPADRYLDLFASVSETFDAPTGPGEEGTLFVAVEETTVEITVQATNLHGDYWWNARYYVDRRVVRRTDTESVDPRDGELLECRRLD